MTVERYRKKPVEVWAVRWTGDNLDEIVEFAGRGNFYYVDPEDRAEDPDVTAQVYDETHSTWINVYNGQWVIRGLEGEFYPCADDIFQATYEPASADGWEYGVQWKWHENDDPDETTDAGVNWYDSEKAARENCNPAFPWESVFLVRRRPASAMEYVDPWE